MTAAEAAAHLGHQAAAAGTWTLDPVHASADDFLCYCPSRADSTAGAFLMLCRAKSGVDLLTGHYADALPHIGEAAFSRQWEKAFGSGAEALRYAAETLGYGFLRAMPEAARIIDGPAAPPAPRPGPPPGPKPLPPKPAGPRPRCEVVAVPEAPRRVYIRTQYVDDAARLAVKAIGATWDAARKLWWVGVGRRADAERVAAEVEALPAVDPNAPPPDSSRILAKVTHKGRPHYVLAESGDRCRIAPLNGPALWADKAACEFVRAYEPREFRGRTEHQTIGSLRRFAAQQRAGEAAGVPACAACGKRGRLVEDLEDGRMKCRGCCDIPADGC